MSINFQQRLRISAANQDEGLLELLLADLCTNPAVDLFRPTQIVVANHAMASWLKDQVARRYSICANLDFMVLPGPLLENIYKENNPQARVFDFAQATFILYDYFCDESFVADTDEGKDLFNAGFSDLKNYLFPNGRLDRFKAFQLANQLRQIFFEYIYLRTEELLSGKLWQQPDAAWQGELWLHLASAIRETGAVTFVDIYQYFSATPQIPRVPAQLYIFGLSSVFPAQLRILTKLAQQSCLNWYHLALSEHYYGDLLDPAARLKIERKMLGYPDLSLDDLYLMDGNPLVANLGQQSRELSELLISQGIELDAELVGLAFDETQSATQAPTLLQLLQRDIRSLVNRVALDYRLSNDSSIYGEPLALAADDSLQIHVCYNRMREVQVLFNQIVALLERQPDLRLDQILLAAPDIDDYTPYLDAVLGEEFVVDKSGARGRLAYSITGNRQQQELSILKSLQLFLCVPYHLPVSYLEEILADANIMASFAINEREQELINAWLRDNNCHFGFSADDYSELGYQGQDLYGLQRYLHNLSLGLCIPHAVALQSDPLPLYRQLGDIALYDNLEYAQYPVLTKLNQIIASLVLCRETLYRSATEYSELSLERARELLEQLKLNLFSQGDDALKIDAFIASLNLPARAPINQAILNNLLSDYVSEIGTKIRLSGRLTCASLQNMRNIPYRVIYLLGMNFGEFPRPATPNQLSLLAKSWYIADRNYNLEDKQLFLDTILACGEKLYLSYVGINENNNSRVEPSPVLSLLEDVLSRSLLDGQAVLAAICHTHALHPFAHQSSPRNYSGYWAALQGRIKDEFCDQRWDFSRAIDLSALSPELQAKVFKPSLKDLLATLLYSNHNLLRVLQINNFAYSAELSDEEPLQLNDLELAKQLQREFSRIEPSSLIQLAENGELFNFMQARGILAPLEFGQEQFKRYWQAYAGYLNYAPQRWIRLQLELQIAGQIYRLDESVGLDSAGYLSLLPDFTRLRDEPSQWLDLKTHASVVLYAALLNAAECRVVDEHGEELLQRPPLRVVQISAAGTPQEYQLKLTPAVEGLAQGLFEFYAYSLTNPTLIHRGALREYLSISAEESSKILFSALLANHDNSELERLRSDPFWAAVIDDYPDFITKELANGKLDTLTTLAAYLSTVSLTPIEELT